MVFRGGEIVLCDFEDHKITDDNLKRIRRLGFIAAPKSPSSGILTLNLNPVLGGNLDPPPYINDNSYISRNGCKFWLHPVDAVIRRTISRRNRTTDVEFLDFLYSDHIVRQDGDDIVPLTCLVVDVAGVKYAIYNSLPPREYDAPFKEDDSSMEEE